MMQERTGTPWWQWLLLGFGVGLVVGWFVLGWGIAPVQYTNVPLQDVSPAAKQAYVKTVAEAYQLNRNGALAKERLQGLGSPADVQALANDIVTEARASGELETVDQINALVGQLGLAIEPAPAPETAPEAPESPEGASSAGSTLRSVCLTGLGLLVVLGGIALALWLLSNRGGRRQPDEAVPMEMGPDSSVEIPDWEEEALPVARPPVRPGSGPAVREYVASYHIGDSAYDESFDIESAQGDSYLGECGMTLTEFVGGDPSRPTAMEVWLFDKSDIRTVTKVLLSDYAFNNQATRDKVSSRGEGLRVAPNLRFVLDAQTLRLEAEVMSLRYVQGDSPPNATIQELSVRMRVIAQAG